MGRWARRSGAAGLAAGGAPREPLARWRCLSPAQRGVLVPEGEVARCRGHCRPRGLAQSPSGCFSSVPNGDFFLFLFSLHAVNQQDIAGYDMEQADST